jgi:hypothetical protein
MFKNSDSGNETEHGHTHSGRVFRGFHLENLLKKNYGEEGFYSGEEADLMGREHSEPTETEEGQVEELQKGEPETLETVQTIEVSTLILLVDSVVRNQSNPSHQSI